MWRNTTGLTNPENSSTSGQQQFVWGDHTFMAGFDYFSGHLKYRNDLFYAVSGFITGFGPFGFTRITLIVINPRSFLQLYLLDYWRLHPKVLMEAGVFKDYAKNSRYNYEQPVSNSLWNFRLGLNLYVNPDHTLRFLVQRNLNTHYFTSPSLVPPVVAGFPGSLISTRAA